MNWKFNLGFFNKLFIKLAFMVVIIILALTVFLYFNFKSYSVDLLSSSNEKINTQVFDHALQINSTVRNLTSALYNQSATIELMYGEQTSVLDTLNSLKTLDMLIQSVPQVYSAYVFNHERDQYFMLGPNIITRETKTFFDQGVVQLLENSRDWIGARPVPRMIQLDTGESVPVLTYISADYTNDRSTVLNALIINVDVNAFFQTLDSYEEKDSLEGNNLMILDDLGRVVAHSDPKLFLADLSNEAFVQQIRSADETSGYFIADVNQERSVVTYSTNKETRWIMVNVTPLKYVSATINKIRAITITIGLLMMLVFLFLSYLLSRHIYHPIGYLRQKVQKLAGDEEGAIVKKDDIDYIAHSLSETAQRLQSLQSFKSSNLHIFKQELLKALLHQHIPADLERKFRDYQILIDLHASIKLVMLSIDDYASFCAKYNQKEQSLIKYALMNITEEIVQKGSCVDIGESQIILIMNYEDEQDDNEGVQLEKKLQQIQSSVQSFISVSVSMFVSSTSATIREINELYSEVLRLSKERIKAGHGCILYKDNIEHENAYQLDPALLSRLGKSINQGRLEEIQSAYTALVVPLQQANYYDIMYTVSSITTTVFQSISHLEKNSMVSFDLDYIEFDNTIKSLETIDQIHASFEQLFQTIVGTIEKNKSRRSVNLIEKVEQYIREHYQDPAISTKSIADHFNISPPYLRKLFRVHLSKSLSEYLTEVRLEKASELLVDTALTVDEIIEQIGWENKNYFFTVFKKYSGATPTEYRLKAKMEHS